MRPYRGLTKDGKWVKGWYVYRGCVPNDTHYIYSSGFHYEVIPETVGQSTGLKDKNGKEIYEGDIIELINPAVGAGNKYIIIWKSSIAGFGTKHLVKEHTYTQILSKSHNNYIVIGNIHENPELLKIRSKK